MRLEQGLFPPTRFLREGLIDPQRGYAVLEKPPPGTIAEVTFIREILNSGKNVEFISCEEQGRMVVFDGRRFGDARVAQVPLGEMHRDIGTALNDGFEVHLVKEGTNGDSNRRELKQDTCSLVLLKPVTA